MSFAGGVLTKLSMASAIEVFCTSGFYARNLIYYQCGSNELNTFEKLFVSDTYRLLSKFKTNRI
jgi:hypothetical protein